MRSGYRKFMHKLAILAAIMTVTAVCVSAQSLPSGWLDQDIGQVGLAGSATYSNGTFTLSGAGLGLYAGSADGAHFAYLPLSGDGVIVARLASLQGSSAQVGLMIRETLDAGAKSMSYVYVPGSCCFMVYQRTTTGGSSSYQYGGTESSLPYWIKLVRAGATFTGYASSDGVNWVQGTSQTVSMAQNVYAGLAVSSTSKTTLATATFDYVSFSSTVSPGPNISSVSATTAAIGSQVVINGSGFGATQGGSGVLLNNSPMTVNSWSDTSIVMTISVSATSGYLVVSVAPSMNDSNVVDFEITPQPLPASWLDQDVGSVGLAGSATYTNGVFTIKGAGQGLYSGTSDGAHFAYQPLSGDGVIVARLASLQGSSAQVGLMIRETLDAGAKSMSYVYVPGSCCFMVYQRTTTGGSSSYQYGGTESSLPYWIKLVRAGATFTGYASSDGVNWVQSTSQTVSMAQNVYAGLVVSSTSKTTLATATFDYVSFSSTVSPGPNISSVSATTAAIGSQVVINGSGFGATQGGSGVLLNNSPMTVNSWSDTSIVMTISVSATSGYLVVSVAPTMNDSNVVDFAITSLPLPSSWLDQDVGSVGIAGSATYSNDLFTVKVGSGGIGNTADSMHFVYQALNGDGSIVARVNNIQGGSSPSAGVMIRETLNPSAKTAFVYFYPSQVYLCYRPTTGGGTSCQSTSLQGVTNTYYPYWVKLARSGATVSAYASADGVNWIPIGASQTITMAESAYVGLASSSNSKSNLSTASVDKVSVGSPISPPPNILSISATTGSIGNQVVISGVGFGASQGNSVVTLNGTPMTINSWSASSITFTIASGATTGLLVVSVAPSMNDSNPIQFEITTQPLPQTWLDQDVGGPGQIGLAGSATYSGGAFTLKGAGAGIGNTSDGFHFVYQTLEGDGTIVARVSNIQGGYYRAGVMIRETLNPNAESAFIYFYPSQSYLCYRSTTGGNTTCQAGSSAGLNNYYPYWAKLTRSGNVFAGYISTNGRDWTQIGASQTISMAQTVCIGLAANGATNTLATDTFDSVSITSDLLSPPVISKVSTTTGSIGSQVNLYGVSFGAAQGSGSVVLNGSPVTVNSWSPTAITITIPTGATSGFLEVLTGGSLNSSNPVVFNVTSQPLPAGWSDIDIGATILTGSATYPNSTFTVNGAGQGLSGGTADAMHFVYSPLNGDGVIIARLDSAPGSYGGAGLMIRETMDSVAKTVLHFYSPSSGYFTTYERTTAGTSMTSQQGAYQSTLPYWMKLARTGNTFNAYVSSDGVNWVQSGTSQTVTMASNVYVGLVANSGSTSSLGTATFDSASSTAGTMPMISGISPASGGLGTQVTVNGSNFGGTQGTSAVYFNGTPATSIASWTNTQIVANFPSNATSGPVTVVVNSIQSNTNVGFTLYNPVVASVNPGTAQVGATVTVAGSGFGASQGTSQVFFNGTPAYTGSVITWSDSSVTVLVPMNATSGPLTVLVGGVTSNAVQFNVETLSVTGISPSIGSAGATVTITGTGFGATQSNSTVDFWGTTAAIQSWSDTQIVATVPAGAPSGSVDVTVGGVLWYGPKFTMTETTHLTDSNGNQSTYTSALVGGIWRPLVGQGSGCSTCTQRGNISYAYDANGNALSRTDENGNTTTYTYDSNGNVATVTVPISSGHTATTTYIYNSFGEVLTATDPMGFVTTNAYDAKGNLLSVTTPAPGNGASASVTHLSYNSLGQLTNITDPRGNATSLAYTPAGLIQTITDAQSNVTTYGYDNRGNRTSVTDANNKQTTFTYDAMNRLTQITYPDSTTTQFGYDYRGRRTSVTDQNSRTTTYAYDDADRLISVTDAASNVTTYGFDTENNLTSIQDANHNTTYFAYDAFGRVTQTTFPSGYVETYGYDNVGNLTSKTDRKNQLINYTYDQLNRLTQKSYPDTSTVNYTYDNDSRLTQVTDPTGTYQFTFDNMGRLSGTSTQYAFLTSRTFTTAYSYDAASNRTGFTDPESGSTTYVYDTLNRLQTLTPPAAISGGSFGFGYDALSRRTSLTRPNAVNTSYSYDNLSRLLSITHALSGTTLDGATYTVDNAGNRLTRTPQPNGTTSTFGYDNIYELQSVTQNGSTMESYTYDPVGNRLTNLGSSSWSYNTSNELNSRPSYSYTYDANGNTIVKTDSTGTTNYTWDFENRLTSVTLPGSGGTVSFKSDPFGRRIYKSSSSGTSIYAYDRNNLIEETNAAGGVVARYSQTEQVDEPLAMLRSSTTSYFQADGLGSTTSLSNTAGSLAQTYTFDSFGNQIASSGSLTNPFRYTGREFDTETGLYFYRARYFDPQAGRFLSEDPAAFDAGNNFYAYVGNDPTTAVDPSGMAGCYYSVQGHVMLCWSNKGGKPLQLGPSGVSSGADKGEQKCKDNPACENTKDLGPIKPGRYKMNLDTRVDTYDHAAAGQYRLEPWPHHFWDGWLYRRGYTRGGFELHKGTYTFGCINADKTNPDAVNQYNQLQQLLQSEDGSNFLNVF